MPTNDHNGSDGTDTPSVDEIQAEIRQAREELGETIEALSAKLDVKTRAKNKVDQVRQQTRDQVSTAQARAFELTSQARSAATTDDCKLAPVVLVGAASVLVLVVAGFVWQQRRR